MVSSPPTKEEEREGQLDCGTRFIKLKAIRLSNACLMSSGTQNPLQTRECEHCNLNLVLLTCFRGGEVVI